MLRKTNKIRPLLPKLLGIEKAFLQQQSQTLSARSQPQALQPESKALTYFETKLAQNESISSERLAQLTAEVYQDNGKAMLQKAEDGDAVAQFMVGWFFENGLVVKRDETEGAKWYEQAATQAQPDAIVALGRFYVAHDGMDQPDKQKSALYFKQVIHLNNHLGEYARTVSKNYDLDVKLPPTNQSLNQLYEGLGDLDYVRAQSTSASGIDEFSVRKEVLLKKTMAQNYYVSIHRLSGDYVKQGTLEGNINHKILFRLRRQRICNGSQFIAAEQKWGKNFGHLTPIDTIELKFEKEKNHLYTHCFFNQMNCYVIKSGGLSFDRLQELYYLDIITHEKKTIPISLQENKEEYTYNNCIGKIDNNFVCVYYKKTAPYERMLVLWNETLTQHVPLCHFSGKEFSYRVPDADFCFVLFSERVIQVHNITTNPFIHNTTAAFMQSKTLLAGEHQSFEKFFTLNTTQGIMYIIIYNDYKLKLNSHFETIHQLKMKLLNSHFENIHEFTLNNQNKDLEDNKFIFSSREQKLYHLRIDRNFSFLDEHLGALVLDTYDLKQKQFLGSKMLMPNYVTNLKSMEYREVDNNFSILVAATHADDEGILIDLNAATAYPLQVSEADESKIPNANIFAVNLLYVHVNDQTLKLYTPQLVLTDAAKKASSLIRQEIPEFPAPVCNIVVDYMSRKDLFFNFVHGKDKTPAANLPMPTPNR